MSYGSEEYNGHPNRETWAFHLHRANDRYLYELAQSTTRAVLARVSDPFPVYLGELVVEAIRDAVEEFAAIDAMRDIGSWWRIDEHHVGATMLAEIAEMDAYEGGGEAA